MNFEKKSDSEFRDAFISILTKGAKNNTYKFALGRFLLDYCSESEEKQVRYSVIAEYFFRYYWLQECKSKLRQGPRNQIPKVITVIRKEFDRDTYPESFKEIKTRGRQTY